MKGNTKAKTPREYLAGLAPAERKKDVQALHKLIRAAAPKLKPYMQSGMLGYGRYKYRSGSGREGEWFLIGLASPKNYISLYVCAVVGGKYLAESNKSRLPKASIGRSCIRFKRLADVDVEVLRDIIQTAIRNGPMNEAPG